MEKSNKKQLANMIPCNPFKMKTKSHNNKHEIKQGTTCRDYLDILKTSHVLKDYG